MEVKQKKIHGAEALVTIEKDRVVKQRVPKAYRLPQLDAALRKQRSRREARLLRKLHAIIRVPKVLDETEDSLILEKIHGEPLKRHITPQRCEQAGTAIGKMHAAQVIHGDLTTSNILVEHAGKQITSAKTKHGQKTASPEENQNEQIVLIDFGLSYPSHKTEDMATDLHVFEELVPKKCFEAFWNGYQTSQPNAQDVLTRLEKLKTRGRNKARNDTTTNEIKSQHYSNPGK